MAFELINQGVTEAAAVVFGVDAGPAYSTGVQLDNPQYRAAAMFCTVSDAGDGLGDLDVDIIVQTAPAGATSNADWINTKTRINGVTAFGMYQILVTDPVLALMRAQIVKSTGTEDVSFQFQWGADRSLTLI